MAKNKDESDTGLDEHEALNKNGAGDTGESPSGDASSGDASATEPGSGETTTADWQAGLEQESGDQLSGDWGPDGADAQDDPVMRALFDERDSLKDQLLRALADVENMRRRTERELLALGVAEEAVVHRVGARQHRLRRHPRPHSHNLRPFPPPSSARPPRPQRPQLPHPHASMASVPSCLVHARAHLSRSFVRAHSATQLLSAVMSQSQYCPVYQEKWFA